VTKGFYKATFQNDKAEQLTLERHHELDSVDPPLPDLNDSPESVFNRVKYDYEAQGFDTSTLQRDLLFYLPWERRTKYEKNHADEQVTRYHISIDNGNPAEMDRLDNKEKFELMGTDTLHDGGIRYHFIYDDPDPLVLATIAEERTWRLSELPVTVAEMERVVRKTHRQWKLDGTGISPIELMFMMDQEGYRVVNFELGSDGTNYDAVFIVDRLTPAELRRKEGEDRWEVSTRPDRQTLNVQVNLPHLVSPGGEMS
jgi:hypothetical protein